MCPTRHFRLFGDHIPCLFFFIIIIIIFFGLSNLGLTTDVTRSRFGAFKIAKDAKACTGKETAWKEGERSGSSPVRLLIIGPLLIRHVWEIAKYKHA
jgi:hypothetical protein